MPVESRVFDPRLEIVLRQIGLREFYGGELRKRFTSLSSAIWLGINRDPSIPFKEDDGGLIAVNTAVLPISSEQWENVPVGARTIGCAFAGTNWITACVEKKADGKAESVELGRRSIPENKRTYTLDGFVELMADQIVESVEKSGADMSGIDAVGIALGFAQRNQEKDYGIEAQFLSGSPAKEWTITDFDSNLPPDKQPLLGDVLLQKLNHKLEDKRLGHIKRVYFQNDTNAVANNISVKRPEASDVQGPTADLNVGFVFGTGDNASIREFNLEAGKAKISSDQILLRMRKLSFVSSKEDIIEYLMGGDYIKKRIGVALRLLEENKLFENSGDACEKIISSSEGALISLIASGELSLDNLNQKLGLSLNENEFSIVKKCSVLALKQAGQLMGVFLAAVSESAGYSKEFTANLPIEGAVFWEGYGVKKKALETLDFLIPNHHLTFSRASGLVGIAQLVMVRENKAKHREVVV